MWREIFTDLVNGFDSPVQNLGVRVLGGQDPNTLYTVIPLFNLTDPVTGESYTLFTAQSGGNRLWDGYADFWGRRNNFAPVNAFNNVDQHTVSFEVR
ncbi:hypothetical protein RZS08_01800, partial [Arthrospira platensis SPKY1]|nr:hypothetical protein [Arthrospira platensis SPKY1]